MMFSQPRLYVFAAFAFVLAAQGCASAAARAPAAEPVLQGGDGRAATAHPVLPELIVAQVADGGRRIARFQAVDQDLRVVLRQLAEAFDLSYQIDPDVTGSVTTRLDAVTLEQALATVMPRGYSYTLQGNVLVVRGTRMQTRIFALDYVSLYRQGTTSTVIQRSVSSGVSGGFGGGVGAPGGMQQAGQVGGGGFAGGGSDAIVSTTVADLWEEVRVALEAITFSGAEAVDEEGVAAPATTQAASGGGGQTRPFSRVSSDGRRLIINPMAGQITVTAPAATLGEIETFLAAFENSVQRQVIIEAKIVEVQLRREFRFGVNWQALGGRFGLNFLTGDAPSGTVTATVGGGESQITVILRALETQGDVSVLSSPRINAMNNQRAVFDATTNEVFYAVTRQPLFGPTGAVISVSTQVVPQHVSVGIVLDVLSQIGADNTVTMNIRPLVSSVSRVAELPLEDGGIIQTPIVDRRQTDTMARVRAGETVVIGGLMQNRRERSRSGVPGLRDIPLIGRVFTGVANTDQQNELVVFLTPTIVIGQAVIR